MDCKIIHRIFGQNEELDFSNERDAQIRSLLEMGRIKEIRFEFISKVCSHQQYPSQIFWCEIPIMEINCLGEYCYSIIINNYPEILFQLIQPIVQLPKTQYISILSDIKLPGWKNTYEFIIVINCTGNLLLIPTKKPLPVSELDKVKRNWHIKTKKILKLKKNLKLINILAPKSYQRSDFRIFFKMND